MSIGVGSDMSYCALIPIDICIVVVTLLIAKGLINQIDVCSIIWNGYVLNFGLILFAGGFAYLLRFNMNVGLLRLIATTLVSSICAIIYTVFVILSEEQRKMFIQKIKVRLIKR